MGFCAVCLLKLENCKTVTKEQKETLALQLWSGKACKYKGNKQWRLEAKHEVLA